MNEEGSGGTPIWLSFLRLRSNMAEGNSPVGCTSAGDANPFLSSFSAMTGTSSRSE